MNATLRTLILVFDGVEVLDFAGPFEVFTTASRVYQRMQPGSAAPFEVACVARTTAPIRARAGLTVLPEWGFDGAPAPDLLIVPGGVVDAAERCTTTLAWIAQASHQAQITASICTGTFLLAASGVLAEGQRVTTHWEDLADLRQRHPTLHVEDDSVRWVDSGRTVTSAGISAGIDMSLHLVARLTSPHLAQSTARQMDYPWHPVPTPIPHQTP